MKKICSVVGARPQFIKLAIVSKEVRKKYKEIIIHTGQHFDYNMSDVFFEKLRIPKPDYNLGISSKSHAEMTALMMIELEKIFLLEKPDGIIVYGDTNSTLAAALTASKLCIPIFHVEAGNRFHNIKNPEEINRIITDHVSTINFACTKSALEYLQKENIGDKSFLVGDPMYEAYLRYSSLSTIEKNSLINIDGNEVSLPKKFYYMTCHRQENTNDERKLLNILSAMNTLDAVTVYAVHPRNKETAMKIVKDNSFNNIILINPVDYFTSIYLVNHCAKVVTDSGGLQREAFFAKKKCVTILDFVCWPETMKNNCNELAKPIKEQILKVINNDCCFDKKYYPFGNGDTSKKISKIIGEYLN